MKSIYLSLFASLLFSLNNNIIAQYELLGQWEVFCPIEQGGSAPIRYCDICSTEKVEKHGDVVFGFEMEFKKDSLHIINAGITSETVSYKWDEKLRIVDFKYQTKNYSFLLLNGGYPYNRVLKDKNCLLLLLTKKEVTK